MSNCTVRESNRGIALQIRDGGNVENVIFSNIAIQTRLFHDNWWGKGEPIHISCIPRHGDSKLGVISNVLFSNIIAKAESGIYLFGHQKDNITNVTFDTVALTINKCTSYKGGIHDRRPSELVEGLVDHPTSGIYCAHAQDITFRNTRIRWGENIPDYFAHAFESHDMGGLELDNFSGRSAFPDQIKAIVNS
ncbi:MAG: hypothetical protein GF363_16910 [Chitinivibrionales bacterium]|nr:hypothetical protein [Chitinivibrionales bacterium]